VNVDIKAITNAYKQGINNTERNNDSYAYTRTDYSTMRNEQEEAHTQKKNIALELNNMTKRASRGLKEDYLFIISNLEKLKKDITDILTNV